MYLLGRTIFKNREIVFLQTENGMARSVGNGDGHEGEVDVDVDGLDASVGVGRDVDVDTIDVGGGDCREAGVGGLREGGRDKEQRESREKGGARRSNCGSPKNVKQAATPRC